MGAFEGRVAVVTGGAKGIGKAICEAFRAEGARVFPIDLLPCEGGFVGDVGDPAALEAFADRIRREAGRVDAIVNNALPLMKGLDDCTWDEFNYALRVGVSAPFYLVKLLRPLLAQGASIVNIASSGTG